MANKGAEILIHGPTPNRIHHLLVVRPPVLMSEYEVKEIKIYS